MIGSIGGNQKSWRKDGNGQDLPEGEFHAVRVSMGFVGGTKDTLIKEILTPCAQLANCVFNEWPIKMNDLPLFMSDVFGGSTKPSYTTISVTLGNESNRKSVLESIDKFI